MLLSCSFKFLYARAVCKIAWKYSSAVFVVLVPLWDILRSSSNKVLLQSEQFLNLLEIRGIILILVDVLP